MPEPTQWEYIARSLGSFFSGPKDAELESLLNELGAEGWEVVSLFKPGGGETVRLICKRPLSAAARRRRSWPG